MARRGTTAEAPVDVESEKPMKQQVREAFDAGKTRREIAEEYGVSYQRVYQLTRDLASASGSGGPRPRIVVELSDALKSAGREDLIGLSRAEAIRKLFEEGMKVGDIARLLGTSYQIAFQATKAQRAGIEPEASDDEDEDEELDDDEDEDEDAEE